jgi:hypothetical protein
MQTHHLSMELSPSERGRFAVVAFVDHARLVFLGGEVAVDGVVADLRVSTSRRSEMQIGATAATRERSVAHVRHAALEPATEDLALRAVKVVVHDFAAPWLFPLEVPARTHVERR